MKKRGANTSRQYGLGWRPMEVFHFICRFKTASGGDSPSLEEIAAGVGLASRSTALAHLRTLERHGLIQRGERDARRIAVVGGEWRLRGRV